MARRAGRGSVGVSLLPGSLTSERAKFWLSPMMTPSANAASTAARSAVGGSGDGEGLDALVFAVAAIGVGIEVADECALDSGAQRWRRGGRRFGAIGGVRRPSSRMPRGLAKRTAVPAASRTLWTVALAGLPRPTISRRLAARPAGACSSTVSLAPALYSPLESTWLPQPERRGRR